MWGGEHGRTRGVACKGPAVEHVAGSGLLYLPTRRYHKELSADLKVIK